MTTNETTAGHKSIREEIVKRLDLIERREVGELLELCDLLLSINKMKHGHLIDPCGLTGIKDHLNEYADGLRRAED